MPGYRLILAAICVFLLAGSILSSAWAQDAPNSTIVDIEGGFTAIDLSLDAITEEDRDFIAAEVVGHQSASGALSAELLELHVGTFPWR